MLFGNKMLSLGTPFEVKLASIRREVKNRRDLVDRVSQYESRSGRRGGSMSGLPSTGGGHGSWHNFGFQPPAIASTAPTYKRKRRPAGTPGMLLVCCPGSLSTLEEATGGLGTSFICRPSLSRSHTTRRS